MLSRMLMMKAESSVIDTPFAAMTPSVAIGLQYMLDAWATARHPTVKVEKGYGSGVFQDLYPSSTGELFTAPNGGGVTATAFAAGSRLLVETPYNQSLAGPLASGHPTAITDASRRVLLDLSVPTAPAFAGISQGTQDPLQHATQRGYDLNVSVVSNLGATFVTLDAGGNYVSYVNNGGSGQSLNVDSGNSRWYASPAITVATLPKSNRPAIKINWADANGSAGGQHAVHAIHGGVSHAQSADTAVNATSTPMRWLGPTSPLDGRAWAFAVFNAFIPRASLKDGSTAISRLSKMSAPIYGANEITIYSPLPHKAFPIDLNTGLGAIKIKCASAPNRAIEAQFNGGSYQAIGTTDANGYLVGTLAGVTPGKGTLNVRVVGQATADVSVANVCVGVVIHVAGQSNGLGRGDDYTLGVSGSVCANAWFNLGATSKAWASKFGADLAISKSAPLGITNYSTSASYLYFDAAGSTDGRHGHWAYNNPGTTTTKDLNGFIAASYVFDSEPNFAIWHQGESEGVDGVSTSQYKTSLYNMWTEYQARTGYTHKLWVMQIGRDGFAVDSRVDEIRRAQSEIVDDYPALFAFGGCLAHLPVEGPLDANQNVHFYTLAQKNAVVAVFKRHALGAGRGPRFSSMVASGTTITITCTGGVSPLTISGGEAVSPIGWTVSDGGGAKTVTAVSVSGLVITLTVNTALSGTVTVKWLSHYTGIGTTLLDSDATTPVPPEPFVKTVAAS